MHVRSERCDGLAREGKEAYTFENKIYCDCSQQRGPNLGHQIMQKRLYFN